MAEMKERSSPCQGLQVIQSRRALLALDDYNDEYTWPTEWREQRELEAYGLSDEQCEARRQRFVIREIQHPDQLHVWNKHLAANILCEEIPVDLNDPVHRALLHLPPAPAKSGRSRGTS